MKYEIFMRGIFKIFLISDLTYLSLSIGNLTLTFGFDSSEDAVEQIPLELVLEHDLEDEVDHSSPRMTEFGTTH